MADIKEILSNNPLFANMNKNALLKGEQPKEVKNHLEAFESLSNIQTLFEAKADTWNVTSQEVCKGAECVLNEISDKLGRPYRRGNIMSGKIWNIGLVVMGEAMRTLPEGWEKEFEGLPEKEIYPKMIELLINHIRNV